MKRLFVFKVSILLIVIFISSCNSKKEMDTIAEVITDPLPSWNESKTKASIIAYVNDVTKEDVMSAQNLGLEVNLWGVESSEQGMDHALSLEANSITLARPDLLRDKLGLMK